MSRVPVSLGFNEGRAKPLSASRLVNLFPEPAPATSRAPVFQQGLSFIRAVLYGTPGQKAFATAGSGTIRAMRYALDYLYVLSGTDLYRVDSAGTAILCTGDSISTGGNAMMTDNGVQVTVLSGGFQYTVIDTTITQVTNAAYPAAGVSSIDTIDGYTLSSTLDTGTAIYGTGKTITGITQANPAVVTYTGGGIAEGDQVVITGVAGMTQVNGRTYTARNVTSTTFELSGTDSTSYSGYSSAGTVQQVIARARGQWFCSALTDSQSIAALDYANAESNPDPLLRIVVSNHEIMLFGTRSVEFWQDTGASPFPFERVNGALMERGCAAALSPAKLDNSVFWLGEDKAIYRVQGYQPQRVSTPAVEEVLRAASDVSDAFAVTYSQSGHAFYVLTLPSYTATEGRTLVYDASTNLWHERQSGTTTEYAAWNVNCVAVAWNKVLAGTSSGAIVELDMDTYTDAGSTIRRVAVTPPIYPDGKRAIMTEVELECELGVGLNTGQGSDPTMVLRWSNDGGSTWSNPRSESLGVTGERFKRVNYHRLGTFRQRELEFSISDPVKVAIWGMNYTAQAFAQ